MTYFWTALISSSGTILALFVINWVADALRRRRADRADFERWRANRDKR